MFDPGSFAQFWPNFWPNFLATISGGLALALFFFFLKEHFFSPPVLSGVWECEMLVEQTAYNPFRGMQVCYRIVLLQNGHMVFGAGEKDREIAAKGKHRYDGKNRVPIELTGIVEKRITGADVVRIQWKENGSRISSTTHELRISGSKVKGKLVGRYYATAGECIGHAFWSRVS